MYKMIALDAARWNLAWIWFSGCAVVVAILIAQTVAGAYGSQTQGAFSWALPNFLPTLALMLSVVAQDALRQYEPGKEMTVRASFFKLARALSVFYIFVLSLSILLQPFFADGAITDGSSRVAALQVTNLWLGPLQGLVVAALGTLFFLKQDEKPKDQQLLDTPPPEVSLK